MDDALQEPLGFGGRERLDSWKERLHFIAACPVRSCLYIRPEGSWNHIADLR